MTASVSCTAPVNRRRFSPAIYRVNIGLQTHTNRSFVTVIQQAEVAYREFLGKKRIRLEPGLRWNLPIVHSLTRVSLREDFVPLDDLHSYTKDNGPVVVSGTVFFKIEDAEKVCFSVSNYRQALQNVAESSCRAVVGRFAYDDIISDRNSINTEMLNVLGMTSSDWGLKTTRLEIQKFEPQNHHVAMQLEKQMQAERSRRENELQTQSHIRTAEGDQRITILKSEGELIAARNRSEAIKVELQCISTGLGDQIESLAAKFGGDTSKAAQFLLETKRLEHLKSIAGSSGNKVYFVSPDNMFPTAKITSDLFEVKTAECV